MAYLLITYKDGTGQRGSGAFVSDKVVLTSGHLLHDLNKGWATSVTVIPGGTLSNFSSATTNRVASVNGWVDNRSVDYDYGAVILNNSLGTGSLGVSVKTDSDLRNIGLIGNYGYPGDKPSGTLWYSSGVLSTVLLRTFCHDIDTYYGSSGSPVVAMNNYHDIIGVHHGQSPLSADKNIATRVTSDMVDFINRRINES